MDPSATTLSGATSSAMKVIAPTKWRIGMYDLVAQNESLVKEKLIRALAGGFIGTVIFTLMGKFLGPHVIGQPMDVAALMAPMLGGSYTVGVIAHFVVGTVIFPIAYLVLGIRRLPGPAWGWSPVWLVRYRSERSPLKPRIQSLN
jgi:hypothetical protein